MRRTDAPPGPPAGAHSPKRVHEEPAGVRERVVVLSVPPRPTRIRDFGKERGCELDITAAIKRCRPLQKHVILPIGTSPLVVWAVLALFLRLPPTLRRLIPIPTWTAAADSEPVESNRIVPPLPRLASYS